MHGWQTWGLPLSLFLKQATEEAQNVDSVMILALTCVLDRPLEEDRTICLICAHGYYLNRTNGLCGD